MFRVNCSSSSDKNGDEETERPNTSSLYGWIAGIGGLGFIETAYLTYLKLSNTDVFCPVGGGSCGDVLNSDYALVFGIVSLCYFLNSFVFSCFVV